MTFDLVGSSGLLGVSFEAYNHLLLLTCVISFLTHPLDHDWISSKLLSLQSQLLLHAFPPGWTISPRTMHQKALPSSYILLDSSKRGPSPSVPLPHCSSATMVLARGRAPEAVWSWIFSLQNHKLDDPLSFKTARPRLLCYSSRKLHYDFQKSFRGKSLLFGVTLGQWQAIALGRSSLGIEGGCLLTFISRAIVELCNILLFSRKPYFSCSILNTASLGKSSMHGIPLAVCRPSVWQRYCLLSPIPDSLK